MNTATIETTVTAMEGTVCLFETDVVVTVDYDVVTGDLDWQVTGFAVQEYRTAWDEAKGVYVAHATHAVSIKPGHWFYDALRRHLDDAEVERRLIEQDENMLADAMAEHRADYHMAVL